MFKGRWFWSVIPIVVVLLIMLILMSYGPMFQPGVYSVAEDTLISQSWSKRGLTDRPRYEITDTGHLLAQGDWNLLLGDNPPPAEEWVDLGTLLKVKLTRSDFDKLFVRQGEWAEGASAASLRRQSVQAWGLVYKESVQYYVLQRKGGGIWIVSGFYDGSEKGDRASDDSNLSLVFRLDKEEAAGN